MEYLQQMGLTDFVFAVDWDTRSFLDLDMIEFIQNFDSKQLRTCVRGCPIDVSVESIKNVFKLPVCGQTVEQKASNYTPKTFPPTSKRQGNGSYVLNLCQEAAIRERLEFEGVALHIRDSRLDAAAYQIKQVEESIGNKNWGEYFCNKLVDALCKAQGQIAAHRSATWSCNLGSHLQVILSKRFITSLPTSICTLPSETIHVLSTSIEDGARVKGNEPQHAQSTTLLEAVSDTVRENGGEKCLERFQQSTGSAELDKRLLSRTSSGPDLVVSSPVESKQMPIICNCSSACLHLRGVVEKLEREQRGLQEENGRMAAMLLGLASKIDAIGNKHDYLAKEVLEKHVSSSP